jgi:tetratricopeptide (TPR) repeat protein
MKYRAFFSYSHKDSSIARKLHKTLEAFRLDPAVLGERFDPNSPTLRPIFFDRNDFQAGDGLSPQTADILGSSGALVILASPNSAKSTAVAEEVRLFRWHYPDRTIIPVVAPGAIGDVEIDFFPLPLRFEIDADGTISKSPSQIIAADLRDIADGWELGVAKIVARLVGAPPDQIYGRAQRERRRRLQMWILLLLGTTFIFALLAVYAEVQRRTAVSQRLATESAYRHASDASNNLVGELAEQFQEREGVPIALTVGILQSAANLVDGLNEGGASNPGAERALGVALMQLSDKQRLLNAFDQAEHSAGRAVQLFERLSKSHPENTQYLEDLQVALDRLSDVTTSDVALKTADRALLLARRLMNNNPTVERKSNYANSLSKYAHYRKSSDKLRAAAMYAEALQIQEEISNSNDALEYIKRDVALTRLNIGKLYSGSDEFSLAKSYVIASLADITRLKADHPHTITYVQDEAAVREALGDILTHGSDIQKALVEYRESLSLTEHLSNADDSNMELRLTLLRAYDRVADTLQKLNQGDEAIALYTKGLQLALELGRISPDKNDWPGTRSLLDSLAMSLIKEKRSQDAYNYVNETSKLLKQLVLKNTKLTEDLAKVLSFQSYVAQYTELFPVAIDLSAEAVALSPTNWRIGVNRIHAFLRAGRRRDAAQYFAKIRDDDSTGGQRIVGEIEKDLESFRTERLPEEFLTAVDKFVGSVRDGL